MNCPNCGERLMRVHVDYLDSFLKNVLLEEEQRCPNGCYEWEYAYGATRERWAPWPKALAVRARRFLRWMKGWIAHEDA